MIIAATHAMPQLVRSRGRTLVVLRSSAPVHRLSSWSKALSTGALAPEPVSVVLRVCMAEFSDARFDARVLREARSLCTAGYRVDLYMYNSAIASGHTHVDGKLTTMESPFPQKARNASSAQRAMRIWSAARIVIDTNFRIALSHYDVYHAHNLKYALASAFAARRHGVPLVYDAHELHYAHYDPSNLGNRVRNMLGEVVERLVSKHAAAVIEASAERAAAYAAHYRVDDPVVIRNTATFVDCRTRDGLMRQQLGLPWGTPILFYSGGIYAGGGRKLDVVIESLKRLSEAHLVIAGFMNDSIQASLRSSAHAQGVGSRVHLVGSIPAGELIRYASGADIGVIPLSGESLNTRLSALNKVSEYLMAGLALACSDYPVLRRIARDAPGGPVGEVFDVTDPSSVGAAVKRLMEDGQLDEYRVRALKRAADDLRWDIDERNLLKLYARLPRSHWQFRNPGWSQA